jgi:hypothetical protein
MLQDEDEEEENEELEPFTRQETTCDICGIQYASDIEQNRDDFVYMCRDCEMEFIERIRELLREAMEKRRKKNIKSNVKQFIKSTSVSPGTTQIDEIITGYLL